MEQTTERKVRWGSSKQSTTKEQTLDKTDGEVNFLEGKRIKNIQGKMKTRDKASTRTAPVCLLNVSSSGGKPARSAGYM